MQKQVTNRIAEISRPSQQYPRSFVPEDIDLSEWDNIEPLLQGLLNRKLDSRDALEKWLLDGSEIGSVIQEEGSRRFIAMTCATDDMEAEKAHLYFIENIIPRVKPYGHKINLKLIECPYTQELDKFRYEVLIRDIRNSIELFREENIPIEVEIAKLSQEYQKIVGAMTITFKGKEYTLPQMGIFLQDRDRDIRHESWQLSTDRRLQDAGKIDELFDKMLKLRTRTAKNAGFDNFIEFQFRRFGRFDYSPEDCFAFHDAVERHVVPLTRKMTEKRLDALKIDTVRPWDAACDRLGRDPLKPFETTERLVAGCREIFGKVDGELGDYFQCMIDKGLLDLDSRKGKAPGGYQSSLTEVRLPFIFMNAVGLDRDVFTLLHEGGHAFHQFVVNDEPLLDYRHSPMEFAEVASMSMELLAAPYLETFYAKGDAARSRYDHLSGAIGLLPWIATVDSFQHWIYSHPGHTSEERSDEFIRLISRFGTGVDWAGLEDSLRHRWHAQLHIFMYPFYYIEYGIAQLGALQVWQNSRRDRASAVEAYKSSLQLGGTRPLPELFKAANARFDFSDKIIEPLMADVSEEIEKMEKLENS